MVFELDLLSLLIFAHFSVCRSVVVVVAVVVASRCLFSHTLSRLYPYNLHVVN